MALTHIVPAAPSDGVSRENCSPHRTTLLYAAERSLPAIDPTGGHVGLAVSRLTEAPSGISPAYRLDVSSWSVPARWWSWVMPPAVVGGRSNVPSAEENT